MKKTIFIFLFSFVLNQYYLPKDKSIRPTGNSGIVYLNATEFDLNKKIYILITAHNSNIDNYIYYNFSDNEDFPTPSIYKKVDSTFSSKTKSKKKVTSTTYRYSYEIVKTENKKYLYFSFSGYKKIRDDDYLEIENTKINISRFWTIFIIASFCLVFLLIVGLLIYCVIKQKYRKSVKEPLLQNQIEMYNANSNSDIKMTENSDFKET